MIFQPMSGPGFKVHKKSGTVQQVRDEIQRRLSQLAGPKLDAPPIVPADRGRWSANWRVEDWSGVTAHRSVVEPIVVGVMREMDVEESDG
jgi:hypothetical protein